MTLNDLAELSKLTGWQILNPENKMGCRWCPQITYNGREDPNNFASLWWNSWDKKFRFACKVEGRKIYNDKILNFKKIETYVKWIKKCEEKIKDKKAQIKLAKVSKDFK